MYLKINWFVKTPTQRPGLVWEMFTPGYRLYVKQEIKLTKNQTCPTTLCKIGKFNMTGRPKVLKRYVDRYQGQYKLN